MEASRGKHLPGIYGRARAIKEQNRIRDLAGCVPTGQGRKHLRKTRQRRQLIPRTSLTVPRARVRNEGKASATAELAGALRNANSRGSPATGVSPWLW